MHPSKDDLIKFVSGKLDIKQIQKIKIHVAECEFCSVFVAEYNELYKSGETVEQLPERFNNLADKMFQLAVYPNIIELKLVKFNSRRYHLAADGKTDFVPIENIATLSCSDSDVVLQLIRDNEKKIDYIQLLADTVAHIVIEVPEKNISFVTDEFGRALLTDVDIPMLVKCKWRINKSDVTFDLQEFVYDPDITEESTEIILCSEKNDKIKVILENKTEGKQIVVEIIALDGDENFESVKVGLVQGNKMLLNDSKPLKSVVFPVGKSKEIKIRLFR